MTADVICDFYWNLESNFQGQPGMPRAEKHFIAHWKAVHNSEESPSFPQLITEHPVCSKQPVGKMGMSWDDHTISHFPEYRGCVCEFWAVPGIFHGLFYLTLGMTLFTGQFKPFLRTQDEALQGLSTWPKLTLLKYGQLRIGNPVLSDLEDVFFTTKLCQTAVIHI